MNRYQKVFESLKSKNEAACIPFAVAGDPDIEKSEEIFKAYINGGADILEIGYPFSDPIADGPVNQRAAQRAIASGLNHSRFFALIKRLRKTTDIPFGILLYSNTIIHLGFDNFCKKAADSGIDSLLVPDMPPEESSELMKSMKEHGLGRVFIVSELTSSERMRYICDNIDSFVYVVSRLGATGTENKFSTTVSDTLSRLKECTDKPLAVGFGISKPEHVKAVVKSGADGAIIGSALVSIVESEMGNKTRLLRDLKNTVASLKAA
ncbi:MAG: tryptophan synthase subunit alpha, partial [Fibrobacter sp.]|nr:tryptophan synthase subunit alpha [Fibrobacter sp.]